MIVHDPAAHHTPTPLQLEEWDESRRQDITNQIARLELRKAEERATATATATSISTTTTTATPATIQQKRAEREARRRQLAETATAAEADGDTEEGTGAIGDASATATTSNAIYTISVPTTSDTLAWYDSNNNDNDNDSDDRHTYTYETLDAARAANVWSYPSNAEERARCEVFRDLWEKGYYMGGGSKFGGDWLVYPGACALFYPFYPILLPPLVSFSLSLLTRVCIHACAPRPTGDPLRYHSHFVATVQTSLSAPLRPIEVVAHGRLGTATKKAHLLCGWDAESREVTYISIEWAGFG
jgi:tRNA-splicing endonuclease subunit Sen34